MVAVTKEDAITVQGFEAAAKNLVDTNKKIPAVAAMAMSVDGGGW